MKSVYAAPGAPHRPDSQPPFRGDSSLPPPDGPIGGGGAMVLGSELPVRFTASGSEYFRIWIVNLLLTFVTLGLYYPWAKVRKLRYFYGNTWVGEHALDFHGDARRMLRGTLLVGVLFIAYSTAGQFSPLAGVIALAIVSLLWPALLRTSMRFRLANTSWRGLRFQFNGGMAGAYKALLPASVPAILFVALSTLMPQESPQDPDTASAMAESATWIGIAMAASVLTLIAMLPWMVWSLRRYQHDHYALGRVQTSLRTGPGSFYALFFRFLGVSVLAMVAIAVLLLGVALVFGFSLSLAMSGKSGSVAAAVFGVIAIIAAYLSMIAVGNTYLASRLQNLVWNRTKSTEVRFVSELRLAPLFKLTLKNWLLIALTLGFYWPFAAVASARLKLEAVTIHTRRPVEDLVARANRKRETDATGDVAGDLFGLDFGL